MGQEVTGKKIVMQVDGTVLPPPGDERREVLAERTDALEEAGEKLANAKELTRANPQAYAPINDLQAIINDDVLEVSKGDFEKYHYCWGQTMLSGRFITAKRRQGYEVVSGSMPEAEEVKQADGTRRIGDVILLRIDRERYRKLRQDAEHRRQTRELGVSARAFELAEKYASTGVRVYETEKGNVPDHILKIMERRSKAEQKAGGMMDKFIREGNVPGMPMQRT